MSERVYGDFNGLFAAEDGRTILCLSHSNAVNTESGEKMELKEGMQLTAFDPDSDNEGNRDDLIANGVVIESPEWLKCKGSKWCLLLDEGGYYHESEAKVKQ